MKALALANQRLREEIGLASASILTARNVSLVAVFFFAVGYLL